MQFETIETQRLILKKITPDMFADLFAHYPDHEIMEILGLSNKKELEKERMKSNGGYVTYDRTIVAFLLVLKNNGQTIGRCGFHNWYKDHRKAELGYALHTDEHKRKGLMTEALKTVIAYGFGAMNLNRIEATVGLDNTASQKLLINNGFIKEGHLRQHYARTDVAEDSLIFSLLKQEHNPTL